MTTIKRTSDIPDGCDSDSLLELLRDGERAKNHDVVVEHLEQCTICQHEYDSMAATDHDWDVARDALRKSDWPSPQDDQTQRWNLTMDADAHAIRWNDQMARQLLSPPSHPEMLGRIGRYEVERLVGSGGMGVVFKAHDTELNRQVAVKLLAPYLAGNGPARKRFAREARAAAAIVHDNVVPIHNVEAEREVPYLVMQYIGGESLQARIDAQGALDLCEILRIGMQVASGLAAAHAQGLVHRDIKPSNILLEPTVDRAFITDFGLARAADDASLTRTGFHPGTPQYMSPEQAAGDSVDARSDLFSFGSLLYTMCTGRPPFRADTSLGVLRRIADDHPRPIQEINPNIPSWLCTLIGRLMAKKPDDRFASAAEVAVLLEQCLAHVQHPTVHALPQELKQPVNNRGRYFNRIAIVVATLAAAWLIWFAGTAIVLEYGKGTLHIESNSDVDIPIRIKHGDETVEELTVDKDGSNIRLRAGNYTIELACDETNLELTGDRVIIKSGDKWVAKITSTKASAAKGTGDSPFNPTASAGTTPVQDPRADYWPLVGIVDRFNKLHQGTLAKFGLSPLSEDEVLSAVQWKIQHDESQPEFAAQMRQFVWTRMMPIDLKYNDIFLSTSEVEGANSMEITLNIKPKDSQLYTILIRRQMLSPLSKLLGVTDTAVEPDSRRLTDVISEFNASHQQLEGRHQPPLSSNEVLAAIYGWAARRSEADVDDATFEKFQRIAKTHRFPADTKFEVITHFGGPDLPTYYIWSVRILMPQVAKPDLTYAFMIRNQFVGMDSISLEEIHWGKPNDSGLQVGFRLNPAQKIYTDGQEVEVEFYYRSISGKAIDAAVPNVFYFNSLNCNNQGIIHSSPDKSEKVVGGWRKEFIGESPTVFKGKRLIMFTIGSNSAIERFLGERVTSLTLQQNTPVNISFTVPNFADEKGDKLETGETEIKIVSSQISVISSGGPAVFNTGIIPLQNDIQSEAIQADVIQRLRRATERSSSLKQFQGTWEVTKMAMQDANGTDIIFDQKGTLVFEADQSEFRVFSDKEKGDFEHPFFSSKLHLQGDRSPQHIDVIAGLFEVVAPGIIEADGDIIRMCFCYKQGATDADRPQDFKLGPNLFYVEAKRQ